MRHTTKRQRRHALYIVVLTLLAATQAQAVTSTVSLYGVIDEGLDFTNNAGGYRGWMLQSGDLQGTRWGVLGKEDLGGPWHAEFRLENGFNLSNGTLAQGGRMFGRQAYIGIGHDRYGTVTLGRQYDSFVDYVAPLTANGNWGGGGFAHLFDNDNSSNSFRLNNAIKWTSADLAGWTFGGLYALSNQAGGFSNDRAFSIGGQYIHGPLSLAAGLVDASHPGSRMDGAMATNDANFLAEHTRIWGAGGNYTFGKTIWGLVYSRSAFRHPTANNDVGPLPTGLDAVTFDNIEVSARYRWTPAFNTGLMYTFTAGRVERAEGTARPKWHQIGVIADYSLSVRTLIYAQASYQRASGGSMNGIWDQGFVSGSAGLSSNNHQIFARVGLRHTF